jgi:hypothetical protein
MRRLREFYSAPQNGRHGCGQQRADLAEAGFGFHIDRIRKDDVDEDLDGDVADHLGVDRHSWIFLEALLANDADGGTRPVNFAYALTRVLVPR